MITPLSSLLFKPSISATRNSGRLFFSGMLLAVGLYFGSSAKITAQSPISLALSLQNGQQMVISINGSNGSPCQIQFATNLTSSPWFILTNLNLPAPLTQVIDPVTTAPERYYRSVAVIATNLVWIPAGTFLMGSPTNEVERNTNELRHTVTISKGFFISQFQVTQSNYLNLIHSNPSFYTPAHGYPQDLTRPVEQVSWSDATNYCFLLTQQEQLAGHILTNWSYRLPTESEWEFACRSGTTNAFFLGDNLTSGMANFDGEYEYYSGTGTVFNVSGIFLNRTTAVGGYQPNNAGLYDMAGNVWEWCQDWFGNYPAGSVTNPPGPVTGTARVFRGGSLNATGKLCRSANRNSASPSTVVNTIGFRIVLSPP